MGQEGEDQHRAPAHAVPSVQVLDRVLPHMKRLGVTRLADLTGLDCIGIPVYAAHRPNARSLAVTQGKGATIADAKVSALMEAVELSCAETPVLPLRLASADDLAKSENVIDLESLPRISDHPISRGKSVLWAEGKALSDDHSVWVPYELVHMDYTLPLQPGLGCFLMSSTGLASGSSVDEATCQALAETLERDAVTLWKLNPSNMASCRVDLHSVTDPTCKALLDRFDAAGVACAIWDVTSDLGIPAFFATIIDRQDDTRRGLQAASGAGCHPARGIALSRALTEAAQSRLTLISGARDDRTRDYYEARRNAETLWSQRAEIVEADTPHRFDRVPFRQVRSPRDSLDCMLAALERAGLEVPVAVDLSVPDLPATVMRVIAPGLEGTSYAPGYRPGARARKVS